VHLVRNSVDHGVEEPDVREAKGKPREGIVVLSASQEGDHILLTIKDDGAGMEIHKVFSAKTSASSKVTEVTISR
jgi:two-component system chemotaxis sensor kinase CheA